MGPSGLLPTCLKGPDGSEDNRTAGPVPGSPPEGKGEEGHPGSRPLSGPPPLPPCLSLSAIPRYRPGCDGPCAGPAQAMAVGDGKARVSQVWAKLRPYRFVRNATVFVAQSGTWPRRTGGTGGTGTGPPTR